MRVIEGGLSIDRDFYMILCDFGKLGRCWLEADLSESDTVGSAVDAIDHHPDGVIDVFLWNPAEGFSRNVSEDVALAWWEKHQDSFDLRHDVLPRLVANHLERLGEVA